MAREDTMTTVVVGFGEIVDEQNTCFGTAQCIASQIGNAVGLSEGTVSRTFAALRNLGIIEGPLPFSPRGRGGSFQDWEWRLLKPGAVIVKRGGYYAVREESPDD